MSICYGHIPHSVAAVLGLEHDQYKPGGLVRYAHRYSNCWFISLDEGGFKPLAERVLYLLGRDNDHSPQLRTAARAWAKRAQEAR